MNRAPLLVCAFLLCLSAGNSLAGGKGGGGGTVAVKGHVRKDGVYVPPHYRTAPDANFQNNWSTVGNVNPYTGEAGNLLTPKVRAAGISSSPGSTAGVPALYPRATAPVPATESFPAPALEQPTAAIEPQVDQTVRFPPAAPTPEYGRRTANAALAVPPVTYAAPQRALSFAEQQKLRDTERAQFWKQQGYDFNPVYMTAFSMDQKVRDIERSRFWKDKGFDFNPEYMTAFSMDQKVKDIERARYWKTRGFDFNADYMTAFSMDQKVRDIERAQYWKERGLQFDPNYMTAFSMDMEARRRGVAGR